MSLKCLLCFKAAEQIRKCGFSMAIFAQGWTYETLAKEPESSLLERFINRDNAFWRCLWPFLYTHPIINLFNTSFYIGADKVQKKTILIVLLLIVLKIRNGTNSFIKNNNYQIFPTTRKHWKNSRMWMS